MYCLLNELKIFLKLKAEIKNDFCRWIYASYKVMRPKKFFMTKKNYFIEAHNLKRSQTRTKLEKNFSLRVVPKIIFLHPKNKNF